MNYKTGSYIISSRKNWKCQSCNKTIPIGHKYFCRVKEYGEEKINQYGEKYKHKIYKRWHITCAKTLKNLNQHEQYILNIK